MTTRTTRILHRQIHGAERLPVAAGGRGIEIIGADGKAYIDASGGAAVSCLGHGHPAVSAAIKAQLDKLAYAHTSFFTTEVAERLADHLVAHAPEGLQHVYYVSGGSEAIEAALKMARQYFVEIGEPQRRHFIGRRQSYHGNTLGALAVGGNAWRRTAVRAAAVRDAITSRRPMPIATRRDGETPRPMASAWPTELEAKIEELGPETVIAFVAETVGGATLGCDAAAAGLLQARARDLRPPRHPADPRRGDVRHGPHRHAACLRAGRHRARSDGDRQGAWRRLPADRRGAAVGQDLRGVRATAPAFSSTATPIWPSAGLRGGARRAGDDPARRSAGQCAPRRARISSAACASASAITTMSATSAAAACSGRVEFVTDRATQGAVRSRSSKLHARVKHEAMARGLLVYPMPAARSTARVGDHVLLAPPFIVHEQRHRHHRRAAWATRSMRRSAACASRTALPQTEQGAARNDALQCTTDGDLRSQ